MDKKAIRWIGIQDSYIIREATKRVGLQELLPHAAITEGDRADESEEPEDDDMDIEQLQVRVRWCSSLLRCRAKRLSH